MLYDKIFFLEIQSNVHQAYQDRDLDKRADDRGKC